MNEVKKIEPQSPKKLFFDKISAENIMVSSCMKTTDKKDNKNKDYIFVAEEAPVKKFIHSGFKIFLSLLRHKRQMPRGPFTITSYDGASKTWPDITLSQALGILCIIKPSNKEEFKNPEISNIKELEKLYLSNTVISYNIENKKIEDQKNAQNHDCIYTTGNGGISAHKAITNLLALRKKHPDLKFNHFSIGKYKHRNITINEVLLHLLALKSS
jgi:hypothetical protein